MVLLVDQSKNLYRLNKIIKKDSKTMLEKICVRDERVWKIKGNPGNV